MPKVAPWRLAILAKLAISTKIARGLVISRIWQIFELDAKSGPFKLYNERVPKGAKKASFTACHSCRQAVASNEVLAHKSFQLALKPFLN